MFGLALNDDSTVAEAREPNSPATFVKDLVTIADEAGLGFDDEDMHWVVIYDAAWDTTNMTMEGESSNATNVILTDFLTSSRAIEPMNPFFINNEHQPTIEARTGALSTFRIACFSASKLCAFQILEGDGMDANATIVPFNRVGSDDIAYKTPANREGNGDPLKPDISGSEAHLSMGGGMRETITVQFLRPGNCTVW